jgi:hypothetical protein
MKMNDAEKKTRSPGAGVKPEDGCSSLTRKQVRIDPESEAILSLIGKGNLSLGIREAARRLIESKDTRPFIADRHEKEGAVTPPNLTEVAVP